MFSTYCIRENLFKIEHMEVILLININCQVKSCEFQQRPVTFQACFPSLCSVFILRSIVQAPGLYSPSIIICKLSLTCYQWSRQSACTCYQYPCGDLFRCMFKVHNSVQRTLRFNKNPEQFNKNMINVMWYTAAHRQIRVKMNVSFYTF